MNRFYKITFLVLPLFWTSLASAQSKLYTIAVHGKLSLANGSLLKSGIELNTNSELRLPIPNSEAVFIGDNGEYYIIKVKSPNNNLTNISSLIRPMKKIHTAENTRLEDLFKVKHFNIIDNALMIDLTSFEKPVDDKHFFFVSYYYHGKLINRKLKVYDQQLAIIKSQLFSDQSMSIDASMVEEVTMYYADRVSGNTDLLGTFHLNFLDRKELMKEESHLVEAYKSIGKFNDDTIKKESYIFFETLYGGFYPQQLHDLVNAIVSKL